jgi:hypothetical protein
MISASQLTVFISQLAELILGESFNPPNFAAVATFQSNSAGGERVVAV